MMERSMTMKNLVFALMVVGAAVSAQASYLLWQVTDTAVQEDACLSSIMDQASKDDKFIAKFRYGTEGTAFENFDTYQINRNDVPGTVGNPESLSVAAGGAVQVDLTAISADSSAYAYYVEVLKWDGAKCTQVAVSSLAKYDDLSKAGYIGSDLDPIALPNLQVWTGTSYAAPEPTGGMLVMMGLAFLGLKRRRT